MTPAPRKPLPAGPARPDALTRTLSPETSVVTIEDLKQLSEVASPLDGLYRYKAAADAATLILSSLQVKVNEDDPSAREARKTITTYLGDPTRSDSFLAAIHEQRQSLLQSFHFKRLRFPTPPAPAPPPSAPPLPTAPHRIGAPHDAAALLERASSFKELFQFYYSNDASPANLAQLESLKLLPKSLSEKELKAHLKAVPAHEPARVLERFFDPEKGIEVETTLRDYLKVFCCRLIPETGSTLSPETLRKLPVKAWEARKVVWGQRVTG